MTEQELIQKLEKIERLFTGATSDGERGAAANARDRMRAKLQKMQQDTTEQWVEYRFSMKDMWTRKLFTSLLRSYGISPYRYRRQRYTTVMAKVSKTFVDETLWPEYQALSKVLNEYVSNITEKVIHDHIFKDVSEASVMDEPKQLEA
jgi:hypothetical protein